MGEADRITNLQGSTRDRWDLLRQGPLATDRILEVYDSLSTLVLEAAGRNFSKFRILGQYVWPNKQVSFSYSEELQWTRNWISARLDWMDTQITSFPSSITNPEYILDFQIYPIPFENELVIDFVPLQTGSANLQIINTLGQTIWSQRMDLYAGQHMRENFNINIPSG